MNTKTSQTARSSRLTQRGEAGSSGPDIHMVSNPVLSAQSSGGGVSKTSKSSDLDSIVGLPTPVQWHQVKSDYGALSESLQVCRQWMRDDLVLSFQISAIPALKVLCATFCLCSSPHVFFIPSRLQNLQAELQAVKLAASRAQGQLEDVGMLGGPSGRSSTTAVKTRTEFNQVPGGGPTVSPLFKARISGVGSSSSGLIRQVRLAALYRSHFNFGSYS